MGWLVGIRWVMMRARSSLGRRRKGHGGEGVIAVGGVRGLRYWMVVEVGGRDGAEGDS